ncbi:DUF4367 domain-containing protein [Halobacillus halophilus]|uniref:DUF4367 domain-containing protein n=1 Tax=Halobacillus halophilus (strain ATCC 35676 / DSM 2266 / JCM 20832 / KCTC 3685 / LMG 17431 / NBRC 102448 / NCIMB 2269) TaxID=866895 RepID=I0JLB4_HALH3|nr:DUF4367 domain-containing protein [Halobacillus halophilus]ASF39052.1 DUF4367 domain-containing protein [Halobacillus halophilus]CCG44934.1 hypothetical protein HBHAL_2588 [Halobacillus halophilus DSM 2266]
MIKKLLLMAITLLIAAGCTSNQSSEEETKEESTAKNDVKKVLEQIFSGPDQELTQFYEDYNHEEISNYYMDQFEPYFTETYMDEAMKTNLVSSFHQKAYGNEVKMDIGSMSIEQSEDKETAYDFNTQIDVSNGQSAKVSGRVNTNEEGKITRIHYMDPQPLLHAFDTAVETEDGLFEYDRSRLVSRTENEAYQPKYPTVMPFEVDGVEIEAGPMDQKDILLTFTFHAETEEMVELMTVKDGDISYEDLETKEVSVGEQTGEYAGNKGGIQRLIWKDGSITYELKGNVKDLSEEDLITVAESFK